MRYKIIDRGAQNKNIENELNEIGKDGWELISMLCIQTGYGDIKIRYTFKQL